MQSIISNVEKKGKGGEKREKKKKGKGGRRSSSEKFGPGRSVDVLTTEEKKKRGRVTVSAFPRAWVSNTNST